MAFLFGWLSLFLIKSNSLYRPSLSLCSSLATLFCCDRAPKLLFILGVFRRRTRRSDAKDGESYDPYDFSDTEKEMPQGKWYPFLKNVCCFYSCLLIPFSGPFSFISDEGPARITGSKLNFIWAIHSKNFFALLLSCFLTSTDILKFYIT